MASWAFCYCLSGFWIVFDFRERIGLDFVHVFIVFLDY